jgi:hypothetical protein
VQRYRADIDGVRALAVFLVIAFHFFPEFLTGGYIGVDLFFVISGYLITNIIYSQIRQGNFTLLGFYGRRVQRIFPALLTVLVAVFILGWYLLLTDEYKDLGLHVFGGAFFVPNLIYLQQSGYFDPLAESKPLLHLWSLGVEEQFYLVWPFIIFILFRCEKWVRPTVALSFLWLISLGINVWDVVHQSSSAYYAPWGRFWELCSGGIIAIQTAPGPFAQWNRFTRLHSNQLRHGLSILGLILVLASAFVLNQRSAFPGFAAVPIILGTGMILLAGPQAVINRMVFSQRVIVFVGLISYPLYLWHWPLISFAHVVLGNELPVLTRIGLLSVAVFLAVFTYLMIESPLRRTPPNQLKLAGLIGVCILLALVGLNTYKRNGLEFRRAAKGVGTEFSFARTYIEPCEPITGRKGDDWCHLSEAGNNPELLVIGDSHASAFSTVLSKLPHRGFVQLGRGECPGLIGYGRPECLEIANAALTYAKKQNIKTVVMVSRWPKYFDGFSRDGIRNSPSDFGHAVNSTINNYQSIGKNVVFVYTIPVGAQPRLCVRRAAAPNQCDIPYFRAQELDGSYRTKMTHEYFRSLNTNVFDPWLSMCADDYCRVMSEGKILYLDEDHLSAWGGEFIANQARQKLSGLLELGGQ